MYKSLKLNKRVEKNYCFSSVVFLPHRWQSQLNAAQWRYSCKYKHLPHVLCCLKTDIFENMQENKISDVVTILRQCNSLLCISNLQICRLVSTAKFDIINAKKKNQHYKHIKMMYCLAFTSSAKAICRALWLWNT